MDRSRRDLRNDSTVVLESFHIFAKENWVFPLGSLEFYSGDLALVSKLGDRVTGTYVNFRDEKKFIDSIL